MLLYTRVRSSNYNPSITKYSSSKGVTLFWLPGEAESVHFPLPPFLLFYVQFNMHSLAEKDVMIGTADFKNHSGQQQN